MLAPWAILQAMLQGILQRAEPGGCYYKVLEGRFVFRFSCFGCLAAGRFVAGRFVAGPRFGLESSFLEFSFLAFVRPRSWSSRPLRDVSGGALILVIVIPISVIGIILAIGIIACRRH